MFEMFLETVSAWVTGLTRDISLLLSAARFDQSNLTLLLHVYNVCTSDICYSIFYVINYLSGSWSFAHEHQCNIVLSNGICYNASLGSRFIGKYMYS